jgi:hypothetical protein
LSSLAGGGGTTTPLLCCSSGIDRFNVFLLLFSFDRYFHPNYGSRRSTRGRMPGRIKEKHKGQDEAAENLGKQRKVHKSMSPEWWWTGGRFMQQIGLAAYCFYMRAAMFTVPPIRKCDLWGEIASGIQLIISETW